jgi:adenosylcobinamide-phosphate synthase
VVAAYDLALTLFKALIVDAICGEPAVLYSRVPHPVALLGRLVTALEALLLVGGDPPERQRQKGIGLLVLVAGSCLALGAAVQWLLLALPFGGLWLALVASTLLAQRSLVQHVRDVALGLRRGLREGRLAVARIVGRDPERLDQAAVGRAAIESLAENLSDGVVAPAFWFLIAGLPGLLAYKAVNTLDSMVGHRTERYFHFGWASARLDDLLNLVPARLTALLILAARHRLNRIALQEGWRRTAADAPLHRSPNAGWPEAAMAHALGLRLAGPRVYGGRQVDDAWMGDGRAAVSPDDIERAIGLAWQAWWALLLLVLLVAIAS